ncbi:endonuclease III [Aquicella lusitana]|uniref:Endonuclease III n=1 Tax=Aquicella lusitana TaxID=254246 RepID=A0A370GGA6_9COXI|nr:endonuclease III [Aquicella lusitana]RDI42835.1 DNA-(apurinic or apyrimidinic site) lyase /endonuclease III [Aquicella lusitana]VVC73078.1 Endonuclease III [Aquicella lusitana]
MNSKTIRKIFLRFRKANPKPTTELVYHNRFELLIAVILSAQATDKSVNKATETLFAVANTPEKMLGLGERGLKKYIKTIGLYTTKGKNILNTCRLLIEKFNSKVPRTREELESLPGVGRKTANVILNTCFGEPVIAVDTHIFRVANRIGLAKGKTPLEVEKQLMKNIPDEFKHDAHHWLILHGRYVCVARKPHCPACLINDLCEYPDKTVVE